VATLGILGVMTIVALIAIGIHVQPYFTPTTDRLTTRLQKIPGRVVWLAEMTPQFVLWTDVDIFSPYTSSAEICKKFSQNWLFCRLALPYLGVPENRFLLVFSLDGKVVYHELPLRPPEFCVASCNLHFERAVATFSGFPVLKHNPVK
jgi:hypothetical protein